MPSSNSELYILHAWEDNPVYLKCIQGESGIKIAKFQLVDDNGAINLTGNTGVTFMGTSGNGSAVSVNCTVDTAAEGKISLNASTNFTNAIGNTKGNIVVSFSSGNIQFDGITIKVKPNPAIEALIQDDTFATFLNALARLQDISSGTVAEVDSALSTSSSHPVQNSAIATAINNLDAKFDNYMKAQSASTLDDCVEPNILYKVYVTSSSVPSWNAPSCYCRVFVLKSDTYLTQYVFSGINWKLAVRYKNHSDNGSWSDLKYFAISGDTLAAYGITNAYTKSETYSKTEVDSAINNLTGTVAQNKSNIEQRVAIAEGTVSGHTSAINSLQGAVAQHNTDINSLKSRASALETGMGNVYDKQHSYSKSEVDDMVATINGNNGDLASEVAGNKSAIEGRMDTVEGAVSSHTSAIGVLQGQTEFQANAIAANTNALLGKMAKNFLSVTSFMCDEDGTIFAATDDTVLTNQSFENQDCTSNPYFIWIANTVTEVESNAFINTGKIAKIYCENTSANTPLPVNYQSLPVEYGFNALFAFYIMRSLVTLFNDKAEKSEVYTADNADNIFEKKSNKSDNFSFTKTPTTAERQLYPTVARLKELVFSNFYDSSEVDNFLATISQAVGTKANAVDVYTKTQIDNFNSDFEDRFELQSTVGFDENGIPVFISQNPSFSAGSCMVSNIKYLFIASNVTNLSSGSFVTHSTGITTVFVDNSQENINIQSGALPNDVTIYYKGEFNANEFIISALKNINETLISQLATKLNDADNAVETHHIKDGVVTLDKLAADVIPEIYIGTTDKSSTENGTSTQVYKKHDRYVNKTNGKIWVCASAQLSSSVWQYTWSLKGNLYYNPTLISYTLTASGWNNSGLQELSISGYTTTNNTKADMQISETELAKLESDGCDGIYIVTNENNNGKLIAHAIGLKPTQNITVQILLSEVLSL